jgi:putative flavoprotein involved in K+ transport
MSNHVQHYDTIVIGGGQAGLAVGYHLSRRGQDFVILDAHERIGDAWRRRWDSLRLFTPASHDGLPGMRFPAPRGSSPSKDDMADYLEAYADRFGLPVRTGVRVDGVGKVDGRFLVAAGDERFEADNIVVACGAFQVPSVPGFATGLDPRILQLHSQEYRNAGDLRDGPVLVVGAGNSGADIALDVAPHRETWLSGKHPGHLPFPVNRLTATVVFPILWLVWTHVLNTGTPIGRKVRPKVLAGPEPLIRVRPKHLEAAGMRRLPRVAGVRDGLPLLEDGGVVQCANVIWCTGYRSRLDWIDLPAVTDATAEPQTVRGVVDSEPGLFFVGRVFLHAYNSHTIGGVGRDAANIAAHIASRARREHTMERRQAVVA